MKKSFALIAFTALQIINVHCSEALLQVDYNKIADEFLRKFDSTTDSATLKKYLEEQKTNLEKFETNTLDIKAIGIKNFGLSVFPDEIKKVFFEGDPEAPIRDAFFNSSRALWNDPVDSSVKLEFGDERFTQIIKKMVEENANLATSILKKLPKDD